MDIVEPSATMTACVGETPRLMAVPLKKSARVSVANGAVTPFITVVCPGLRPERTCDQDMVGVTNIAVVDASWAVVGFCLFSGPKLPFEGG